MENPTTIPNLTEQKKQQAKRRNRIIIITILLLLFVLVIAGGVIPSLFNGFFNKAPLVEIPSAPKVSTPVKPNVPIFNTPDTAIQTPAPEIAVAEEIKPIIPKKATQKPKSKPTTPTPTIIIPNTPNLPIPFSITASHTKCNATCADINTVITAGNNTILENGIVYSTNPIPTLSDTVISSSDIDGNFDSLFSGMQIRNNYYVRAYVNTPSGTIYSNQISIINTLSATHASEPTDIEQVFMNLVGNGTAENPYIITNDWELQSMSQDLNAAYKLGNHIDATGTETWNAGLGFTPIGGDGFTTGDVWGPSYNNDESFTGTFDGNGYGILGLTINREGAAFNQGFNFYVGLFSRTNNAKIYNIVLQDNYILGKYFVGGIVGVTDGETEIQNAVVEGVSWARFGLYGGGIIGYMRDGLIDNSLVNGQVHGSGNIIGGLVGAMMDGTISNSTANADVDGGGDLGGLVGRMDNGEILNSCANGNIQGIIDEENGKIGTAGGGFIGSMGNGSIRNSHATGNVDVYGYYAGGFVGNMYGFTSSIMNSYATGDVSIGFDQGGGFVGSINRVNPLLSPDSIEITIADINTPEEIGIHNSYATGDVIFTNIREDTFEDFLTYANEGLPPFYIPFYNSYGGFVGMNFESVISNSYSTGKVIYDYPGFTNPINKGFTGDMFFQNLTSDDLALTNTNNYWDTETSLQTSSADNATPLTTSQMYTPNSFNTWNFDTIWKSDGISYPTLQNNANCIFSCFKETPELPATNPFIFPMDCITPPINNGLLQYVDVCAESYSGEGTTWNDLSPNNRDISLDPSIAYVSSEGGSLRGADYTSINTDLSGDDSLANSTYMTWIKPVLDENSNSLISMNANDQIDSFNNSVYIESGYLMINSSSATYNSLIDDYEYLDYTYNTNILPEANKWYHIAITNTLNEPIRLYINGNLVFTAPDIYPSNLINPPYNTSITYLDRGNISHISAYNRPLPLEELQLFFDATKAKFPTIGAINYGI